ncbi:MULTISPECIES: TM2 domain-containing protein [Rothia]|uniref:TM2 domain-containing protein n=2 Tax=Rothia kristinae TaxID=37923 RepID=A0A7T3FAH5_9MICC|nr:NINE protein [Rothia kristinae]QPT54321.1 TM2 domain-containing protein [Rothia kristinae]TDP53567.1 TM2 domain-containing protein [Kocuria sp. AG109]SIM57956.1 TM2 domain [Mycobacteroides abscessus subsp. abscessus]SQC37064.1 TM2 domain [Rothia kristinae]
MSQQPEEHPAETTSAPTGSSPAQRPEGSGQEARYGAASDTAGELQRHPGQQFPATSDAYDHPGVGPTGGFDRNPSQPQYGQPQYGQPGYPTVVHQTVITPKSMGLAYVLWFFLGGFGAHSFYLGKTGNAVGHIILTILIILFSWTLVIPALIGTAQFIWLIVDACLIPGWTARSNHPQPQAYGLR